MRTLYALVVGIDDYPGAPLRGCVNDVREAEAWLRRQGHVASDIRRLHDGDATLTAVRVGIERHLGRSGPGDTALLWFSGHGSEEPTDAPWEGIGRSQALVCHDSLDDGRPPAVGHRTRCAAGRYRRARGACGGSTAAAHRGRWASGRSGQSRSAAGPHARSGPAGTTAGPHAGRCLTPPTPGRPPVTGPRPWRSPVPGGPRG
ncbi:caspase family protein [Streptomyces sp. NPDC048109]|uniref:caspase family protein n=1 Tax=Streptomyces sp. NPDC048109 TaxID=3155482 RepID=UPI00344450C5